MACRVGITTDPERRKREWETTYPNLTNWQILGTYFTKAAAQKAENEAAARYGCEAHAGGPDADGMWSVYKFDY